MRSTGNKMIAILIGVAAFIGFVLIAGFQQKEAASIGIIGGADGPTAIFIAGKVGPSVVGCIAVAAAVVAAVVFYWKMRSKAQRKGK